MSRHTHWNAREWPVTWYRWTQGDSKYSLSLFVSLCLSVCLSLSLSLSLSLTRDRLYLIVRHKLCKQHSVQTSWHKEDESPETDFILLLTTSRTFSIRFTSCSITDVQAQRFIISRYGLYLITRTRETSILLICAQHKIAEIVCCGNFPFVASRSTFWKKMSKQMSTTMWHN